MTTKQCEVVALVKPRKDRAEQAIKAAYQSFQKTDLFNGLVRTYTPKNEDGEPLPQERKNVTTSVPRTIESFQSAFIELFDTVLTQDVGNCAAKGTIRVEGLELKDVPVTHLLFLESKLEDLTTTLKAIPTLDSAENWEVDSANNSLFKSDVTESIRTVKIEVPLVLYPATDKHPAQTKTIVSDVAAGKWTIQKMSGAIPVQTKSALLERVRLLQEAVVKAREQANSHPVTWQSEGEALWKFIFRA